MPSIQWPTYSVAKRVLDVVVSAFGLILFSPLIAIVAALVATSSPGGPLFIQTRVGRGEKPFKCYKFRTMAIGAPVAGSHEVASSWITPLGRRLRRLKLDELPQLYNVVRGEMSLVGPRPCLPTQSELIQARRALGIYTIAPGITGISQIAGIDMSNPDRLAASDARYVAQMSFGTDLWILAKTLMGKGSGDSAAKGKTGAESDQR